MTHASLNFIACTVWYVCYECTHLSLPCLPSKIAGISLIISLPHIPAAVNTVCPTLQTDPLVCPMSGALAPLKSCPEQWCGCCARTCDDNSSVYTVCEEETESDSCFTTLSKHICRYFRESIIVHLNVHIVHICIHMSGKLGDATCRVSMSAESW